MGTVFYHLSDAISGDFSRGGILFFALFFGALSAMAEIPALYAQRPIDLCHHKAAMYYPFIESLAHTVVDIPIIGQYRSSLFMMTTAMKGFFRLVAAAFKEESSATSVAGIGVLVFSLYTGYTIPRLSIPDALRWITYLNPLGFGFESLMMNEFHTLNGTCSTLVPQRPGYENVSLANQVCTTVGAQPGMSTVDGNAFTYLSYDYKYSDLWRDYGIICAFGIGFLLMLLFATEFNIGSAFDSAVTLFKQSKGAGSVGPVNYVIPISGGSERRLLDDVSGYVAPGKLTALMGESGAGKTTLNVLAQCVDVGIISGDRFINRQPLPSDFQAQTGYCRQTDTHLPQATIRETILSSAHLRQLDVDKCLQMCGLEAYADAVMGLLNLACPQPRLLLFLDEPTSGLDSQSAWAIITFLRELADSGQAILYTIHQRSGELLIKFSFARAAKPSTLVTSLLRCCNTSNLFMVLSYDSAEYMLDVIGAGATASTSVDWHNVWRILPEAAVLEDELGRIHAEGRSLPVVQTELHTQYATSWKHQTIALAQRNFQAYWRNLIYGLVTVSCSHSAFSIKQSADRQLSARQRSLFQLFYPQDSRVLIDPVAAPC
ncbi:hypothetical protein BDR04DRAFT_1164429 [Suillus decipiens]|nr:hypothetical protein BDR04DRAFT_1164429 [Suillus decipiens]